MHAARALKLQGQHSNAGKELEIVAHYVCCLQRLQAANKNILTLHTKLVPHSRTYRAFPAKKMQTYSIINWQLLQL